MGKVNACLRRSYIIVASLIAVMSVLLLGLTVFAHGHFHQTEEIESKIGALRIMYIFSISTLLLSIIGVYGACREKQPALIVFAVGMILGSLFMGGAIINGLAMRPKVVELMTMHYKALLPLADAHESFLEYLEQVQVESQCCGLDQGYLDWGYNISASCLCTEESTNPCVAAPEQSSLFQHKDNDQPIMIYKEPCLPYLIDHEMSFIHAGLGIMFAFVLLWVLSVVLCIVILCQLNRLEDTPTVVYSPEAKAGNYTTLTEDAEYT